MKEYTTNDGCVLTLEGFAEVALDGYDTVECEGRKYCRSGNGCTHIEEDEDDPKTLSQAMWGQGNVQDVIGPTSARVLPQGWREDARGIVYDEIGYYNV